MQEKYINGIHLSEKDSQCKATDRELNCRQN